MSPSTQVVVPDLLLIFLVYIFCNLFNSKENINIKTNKKKKNQICMNESSLYVEQYHNSSHRPAVRIKGFVNSQLPLLESDFMFRVMCSTFVNFSVSGIIQKNFLTLQNEGMLLHVSREDDKFYMSENASCSCNTKQEITNLSNATYVFGISGIHDQYLSAVSCELKKLTVNNDKHKERIQKFLERYFKSLQTPKYTPAKRMVCNKIQAQQYEIFNMRNEDLETKLLEAKLRIITISQRASSLRHLLGEFESFNDALMEDNSKLLEVNRLLCESNENLSENNLKLASWLDFIETEHSEHRNFLAPHPVDIDVDDKKYPIGCNIPVNHQRMESLALSLCERLSAAEFGSTTPPLSCGCAKQPSKFKKDETLYGVSTTADDIQVNKADTPNDNILTLSDKETLVRELELMKKNCSSLSSMNAELSIANQSLKADCDNRKKEIEALMFANKSIGESYENETRKNHLLVKENSNLKAELQNLHSAMQPPDIELMKEDYLSLTSKNAELNIANQNLKDDYDNRKKEIEALIYANKSIGESYEKIIGENDLLIKENSNLKAELQSRHPPNQSHEEDIKHEENQDCTKNKILLYEELKFFSMLLIEVMFKQMTFSNCVLNKHMNDHVIKCPKNKRFSQKDILFEQGNNNFQQNVRDVKTFDVKLHEVKQCLENISNYSETLSTKHGFFKNISVSIISKIISQNVILRNLEDPNIQYISPDGARKLNKNYTSHNPQEARMRSRVAEIEKEINQIALCYFNSNKAFEEAVFKEIESDMLRISNIFTLHGHSSENLAVENGCLEQKGNELNTSRSQVSFVRSLKHI